MKAVVAAFNQEKALVGAFSVITNLRMELFEALTHTHATHDVVRDGLGAADQVGVGRHVAGRRGHGLGVQRQEAAGLGQVLRQHRAGLGLGGGDCLFRYFQ